MTMPREVLPDSFYMITRRCTQRQFLLRPDPELNNAFRYCLIVAAIRYDIMLLHATAMANHHHTVIYDRLGQLCEFMRHFHKLLSDCVNDLRDRHENCWSSDPPSAVRILGPNDVINKLVYAATNPVKDNLVESVEEWPGVNTLSVLMNGGVLHARRPRFFSTNGTMPEEVSLAPELPESLGDREALFETIRQRVIRFEERKAAIRTLTGSRVLGRARILSQSWKASPASEVRRCRLQPRLAARSKWLRVESLLRTRQFIDEYRRARLALLAGTPIPFPPGTYWLRKYAGVQIATS